uniref:Putative secreted protein n=1 Tax=Ixodes ricinus TaxID=34613 RepID=A0A6B0UN60_IXORI
MLCCPFSLFGLFFLLLLLLPLVFNLLFCLDVGFQEFAGGYRKFLVSWRALQLHLRDERSWVGVFWFEPVHSLQKGSDIVYKVLSWHAQPSNRDFQEAVVELMRVAVRDKVDSLQVAFHQRI